MLWKLVENVKYEDIYEVSGHPQMHFRASLHRKLELLDTPVDIFLSYFLADFRPGF